MDDYDYGDDVSVDEPRKELPPIDLGPEAADFPPLPERQPQPRPQPLMSASAEPPPLGAPFIPPRAPMGENREWQFGNQSLPSKEDLRDKKEQAFLKSAYEHATSIAQAVQDVAAARRMIGVMRMDEARRAGIDPREAAYKNFGYFSQPGDKNFAPDINAVRPMVPTKTANPDGTSTWIDPRGVPHWQPQSSIPKPAMPEDASVTVQAKPIMSEKGELLGYTVKTGPQTFAHKWLADMDSATKEQIKQNTAELKEAGGEKRKIEKEAATNGDSLPVAFKRNPDLQARWQEQTNTIGRLKAENIALATKGTAKPTSEEDTIVPPAPAQSDRVRVKSPDGKVGTISRSNLDKAKKAGYSVMDAD